MWKHPRLAAFWVYARHELYREGRREMSFGNTILISFQEVAVK